MLGNFEIDMTGWAPRCETKHHIGFFGGARTFFDIALEASGDDIFPGVGATFAARHDMVNRQIVTTVAAVLAGVIVTMQKIAARKTDFFVGNFDVGAQANHRWQRKVCIDQFAIVLDLFGLAIEQKQHRAAPTTDVERFIGGVQY